MKKIIASVYEIEKEIGSGGGGIVYLAKHLRLGKYVVLKSDKRRLTAKPEVLRREVDTLKNLNHTYIPQVYDFIEEDGYVYTVMDYIEGESFDHILNRSETFEQSQIIEWACELLEALCYLHSRPPHGILHGDIKPANIMLTKENKICLIDFNIALFLGEHGAVKVGHSNGYASPEHYGIEYSNEYVTEKYGDTTELLETADMDSNTTELMINNQRHSKDVSSNYGKKKILIDTRSDIYSLGATLYHIITGNRPSKNFEDIIPISNYDVSPAVANIINKAMNPNPDLRYQSAKEMLYDFENLHNNDKRTKKYKRYCILSGVSVSILFIIGGFLTFTGLKQMEQLQSAYAFSEYSANELNSGNINGALEFALKALPQKSIFSAPYIPEAQKALTDALGVYDLSDGYKAYSTINLPSEPLKIATSPNGKYMGAICNYELKIYDIETGKLVCSLPTEESALSDVIFIDNDIITYAGKGGLSVYNISENKELWKGKTVTEISLSQDKKTIAAVYKDENTAIIYDVNTGETKKVVSFENNYQQVTVNDRFANPNDNIFALDANGNWLAVSFSDGSLKIFNLNNNEDTVELFEESDFTHFEGGFYGKYFAFSATNSENSVFAVINMEEFIQTGGFQSINPFLVQADERGVYISTENILVKIDPETGEQTEVAYTDTYITGFSINADNVITSNEGNKFNFFNSEAIKLSENEVDYNCDFVCLSGDNAIIGSRNTPVVRIMKKESHKEAQVFKYDSMYVHDEARISKDLSTIMLFKYDMFRLYDMNGEIICDVQIPNAEEVYDQQYRRDDKGSYLEVIYNDGKIVQYSAVDGSIISEKQGEKPDLSLYEEFYTENAKITSDLHDAPVVYDIKTGEKIKTLEDDAYLTYVTQVGEYIITEYISSDGERYGLLLNEDFNTIAKLPNLCDIIDNKLIFDYMDGNIRKSDIYSIDELLSIAKTQ